MFGDFLCEKGFLTAKDLEESLKIGKFYRKKLGRLLVDLGKLKQKTLNQCLIEYLKPLSHESFNDLKDQIFSVTLTPKEDLFLKGLNFLAVHKSDRQIVVLSKDFKDENLEQIEKYFSCEAKLKLTNESFFDALFVLKDSISLSSHVINISENLTSDQKIKAKDPYTKLIAQCFEEAKNQGASDIHFEPYDLEYLIRFRVHGRLTDWKKYEAAHSMPLISKLKWILNMDLGVVGQPQDSRATLHSLAVDIRASSIPVISGGEKIVLRLQYQEKTFKIESLGIRSRKLGMLLDSIGKNDGLILISGPTGSGKTTTLYALLEEMDRLGKNISTLENPVEKRLPRINQANLSDHQDFASFQRALMRQDPDVILLGEIRDHETAELSLKLASTGHLVLSTIHANGAAQVIDRLIHLGADPYSIKTNLRLSVAQRLLRLICSVCSLPASEEVLSKLEDSKTGDFRIFNSNGCQHCHSGIIGRKAVIECLEKEELLTLGALDIQVKEPLSYECLNLAKKGEIDVRDAFLFN